MILLCPIPSIPSPSTLGVAAVGIGGGSGHLRCLLILPVHGHALTREHMREGTLVPELACALYEPGAYVLCLWSCRCVWVVWVMGCARGRGGVGERAGETRGAGADTVEFTGDMGEVLCCWRDVSIWPCVKRRD
jgi:hypothetical protein